MRDLIKRARKRVFYFETRKSRGVSERYFTRNRIARRRILTHRVLVRRGCARDERGIHARAFASPRCRRPYLKPLVSLFLKILINNLFDTIGNQNDLFKTTNGSVVTMMRHGKKSPKLNLPADQRKALLRNLTTEVLRHGSVTCTMARAKAVRKPIEHMIQLAKDGGEHKKRAALGYIYDKEVVDALFEKAPARYGDRNGGYTRIVRTLKRRGDSAEMGVIKLV